MTKHISIGCKS